MAQPTTTLDRKASLKVLREREVSLHKELAKLQVEDEARLKKALNEELVLLGNRTRELKALRLARTPEQIEAAWDKMGNCYGRRSSALFDKRRALEVVESARRRLELTSGETISVRSDDRLSTALEI